MKRGLATGARDGTSPWDIVKLCELGIEAVDGTTIDGVVVAVPMLPQQLMGVYFNTVLGILYPRPFLSFTCCTFSDLSSW